MTKVKVASGATYELVDDLRIQGLFDQAGQIMGYQPFNALINGGFDFAQRQAPGTLTSIADDVYCADRWYALTETTTIQYQRTTGDVAPYAGLIKQNQASAQRMGIAQIVEHDLSRFLRGKTVRLTFKAKASTSLTLRYAVLEWTSTADSVTSDVVNDWTDSTFGAGNFFLGSNLTIAATGTLGLTTSFANATAQAVISASCNNLIVMFWTEDQAAQNVTVTLTECMLGLAAVGILDTGWQPRPAAQELALCQRYFEKSFDPDTFPSGSHSGAFGFEVPALAGSNRVFTHTTYANTKRITAPTVTLYDQAGNSGKIGTLTSGVTTNNVTPSTGVASSGQHGFSVLHDDAGSIHGILYHFLSDAEL